MVVVSDGGQNRVDKGTPLTRASDSPFVSIIVTVKNERDSIEACLKSLVALDYERFEIIIIDTGSTDGTCEIVRKIQAENPKVQLLNTVGNAADGRNLGIMKSSGDVLAFTDGDCIADKNWIRSLVGSLLQDSHSTSGVGGPNFPLFNTETRWSTAATAVLNTFIGSGGSVQVRDAKSTYVRSLSTANSAFWADSLRGIGCFDSRLDLCEDADLCSRLTKTGSRLKFEKTAVVYHQRDYHSPKQFGGHMFKYGLWRGKAMATKPRVDTSFTSIILAGVLTFATTLLVLTILGNRIAGFMALMLTATYVLVVVATAAVVSRGVLTTFAAVIPTFFILHLSYTTGLVAGAFSVVWKPLGNGQRHG